MIRNELKALLRLVEVECDGQVTPVTGFRLKNLPQWRSDPVARPLDALGALSGACNCRCAFCFERGHPFPQDASLLSLAEASTRLRYWDPATGRGLPPPVRVFKEPFVNPHALALLRMARERSQGETFWLTSNGSLLTEERVAELATLKPVMVKLSFNSADPACHAELMGPGSRPELAIGAPERLQRHGIPYIGSIVAWPGLLPDDLAASVRHLDRYAPYSIRVRLPVYHRYLYPEPPFEEGLWDETIALCRELAPTLRSPLHVEPSLYWIQPLAPVVDGVIANSPAQDAGLRAGDRITRIGGAPIALRSQALGLLAALHAQGAGAELALWREGEQRELAVTLAPGEARYPYHPAIHAPGERYGLELLDDLHLSHVQQVVDLMRQHESRDALLFTSPAVAPLVEALCEGAPEFAAFFADRQLSIETLDETALGGNYALMDGRLVADFVAQLERIRARTGGALPDLVLIPNALGNAWGIDFQRASVIEIERRFGMPVELIEWPILYGRDV